jgi:exonuclease SbcD
LLLLLLLLVPACTRQHAGLLALCTGGAILRIAHLSDLHLGFRAYHRVAVGGINLRERDVALAFRAALDGVVEQKPDIILIAGDVFHSVRPSNAAIADAFRQFARLHAALPRTPIIMIAGDHDSPRSVETGSILKLFAEIPGITVADDTARTVWLPELKTSVLCLPRNSLMGSERVAIQPDPAADTNILLMHAVIAGTGIEDELRYLNDFGGPEIDQSEIQPERWDYVALGHFHIMTQLAPNMWYSGAIERTSRNVWRERTSDKVFIIYDTELGTAERFPLPTRPVIDLPRFSANLAEGGAAARPPSNGTPGARFMAAPEIDDRVRTLVETIPGGIAGKIVRLVIDDVPRDLFRALDHRQLREYKAEALHFHLDARRPEVTRVIAQGSLQRRRTLDEEVDAFLSEQWQVSSPDIDAQRVRTLARTYLDEALREVHDPMDVSA